MKRFTPRKKKPVMLARTLKDVRIDSRTIIQVSTSISDEDARDRFYLRHKQAQRPPDKYLHPLLIKECYKEAKDQIANDLALVGRAVYIEKEDGTTEVLDPLTEIPEIE